MRHGAATPATPAEPAEPAGRATGKPARRYELDWIRALVVLGLIPVHTALIFTPSDDLYLKDTHTSEAMALIGTFLGVFGMPLLFFVAGAASWFALGARTSARYARERVSRLLVPLIFATLVISPIQAYVVTLSDPGLAAAIGAPITNPHYLDSYLSFYPQYLASYAYFLGHPSVAGFVAVIGQLWFVLYLFVFSMMALPLFTHLRSPRGLRFIERLAEFCARPWAIFALAAPLALVDGLAHAAWSGVGMAAETLLYLVCFIYGYALYADPRFGQAMRRQWVPALAIGLALLIIAGVFLPQRPRLPYDNSMGSLFFIPLRGIGAWFWVVGLVGFAITYLSYTTRLLRYLSDAAYPIYVLHVAAIVSVGYVVIGWDVPMLVKFAVIMVAALALTLGVYEFLIRRLPVMRLLFGLRATPEPAMPPARASAAK